MVHCYWGRGRTGTMLAAYLVKQGHHTARQAITEVRNKRPYSIETYEQEDAIFEYESSLKAEAEKSQVNGEASTSDPTTSMT